MYLVQAWSSNDKNDYQGKQYESKDKPNDVDDSKTISNFVRDETSFWVSVGFIHFAWWTFSVFPSFQRFPVPLLVIDAKF